MGQEFCQILKFRFFPNFVPKIVRQIKIWGPKTMILTSSLGFLVLKSFSKNPKSLFIIPPESHFETSNLLIKRHRFNYPSYFFSDQNSNFSSTKIKYWFCFRLPFKHNTIREELKSQVVSFASGHNIVVGVEIIQAFFAETKGRRDDDVPESTRQFFEQVLLPAKPELQWHVYCTETTTTLKKK